MTLDKSNCDAIALDSIATGLFSFNQTFYVYLYPDADINLCSIENWLVFQIYAIESYTILNCCQTVKNNNISNKTMSCRIYCAASLSFQIQSILFWWVFFFSFNMIRRRRRRRKMDIVCWELPPTYKSFTWRLRLWLNEFIDS